MIAKITSDSLIERIFKNDKRAVSRAISIIEAGNSDSNDMLKELHKNIGRAYRIGITGPPGAGKSTITNQQLFLYSYRRLSTGLARAALIA